MNDLNEIQCFVSVVELKSFTAAARALGVPKSSVSRKIKNLEERLQMTLLIRTTRSLSLTDVGKIYYERASLALQEIESLEEHLATSRENVEGTLRITAPVTLGGPLKNLIASFVKKYPDVNVHVELTAKVIDLVSEQFDFGIRAGKQKDSSLRMRQIFSFQIRIIASPTYFSDRPVPRTIHDIQEEDFLIYSPNQVSMKIPFKNGAVQKQITPRGRVSMNDTTLMKELIKSGIGIGAMPTFMFQDELEKKELIEICPDWAADDAKIYIVYPAQKYISPKMKAFLEHIESQKLEKS